METFSGCAITRRGAVVRGRVLEAGGVRVAKVDSPAMAPEGGEQALFDEARIRRASPARHVWRGGVELEIERGGELLSVLVGGSVTGAVACVETVTGLEDDDLTDDEELFAEASLLLAAKRDAARIAEQLPAFRRVA